ncbi:hypothetical protein WKA22_004072 [Yersinia enterocolitica]|nr:hypothetical protein [Yersinia enterocolitica]
MSTTTPVYVITNCSYFSHGLHEIAGKVAHQLFFFNEVEQIIIDYTKPLNIVLVLDVSSSNSLKQFKHSVNYLMSINCKKRIGVIVSRLNAYLTYYISKKLHGKVTFFNAHNLRSGLFIHNFHSWIRGSTFHPMRTVARYRDEKYGFSLKEWLSLVVPLSGETISEMAHCMNVSDHSLYQVRKSALAKIGIKSYREFCEMYINGNIKIENENIKKL